MMYAVVLLENMAWAVETEIVGKKKNKSKFQLQEVASQSTLQGDCTYSLEGTVEGLPGTRVQVRT